MPKCHYVYVCVYMYIFTYIFTKYAKTSSCCHLSSPASVSAYIYVCVCMSVVHICVYVCVRVCVYIDDCTSVYPLTEEIGLKIFGSPDWTVLLSALLSDEASHLLP